MSLPLRSPRAWPDGARAAFPLDSTFARVPLATAYAQAHTHLTPSPLQFDDTVPPGVLFYPCSGFDFETPLVTFTLVIGEFWFVDLHYDLDRIAARRPSGFEVLDTHRWRPPGIVREQWPEEKQRRYPWVDPAVLTRRLRHTESGKEVTVHWRRGYGTAALAQLRVPISVFFYRRDSQGEGGSGTLWLMGGRKAARPLLREVLSRVPSGGLVVTDGSNCPRKGNPYAPLQQFLRSTVSADDAIARARPFVDREGRRFECVGTIGSADSPTLVWRVEGDPQSLGDHDGRDEPARRRAPNT